MAAVIKWKAQRCFILAALCIILVVTSQLASTNEDRRQLLEKSQLGLEHGVLDHDDPGNINSKRAPFIQDDDSKAKMILDVDGILGPIDILSKEEVEFLPNISRHWEELKIQMNPGLELAGFFGAPNKSCFLWLESCFNLAIHDGILKAVRDILGDPVRLYGLSIWTAAPRSDQTMGFRLEGYHCETVDVLVNSGFRYVHNSHKSSLVQALSVTNAIQGTARVYRNRSRIPLNDRLYKVTMSRLRRSKSIDINPKNGQAYLIHGKLLYAPANPTPTPRTSLLLQFASEKCEFRDFMPNEKFNADVQQPMVPPTLTISSNGTAFRAGYEDIEPVAGNNSVHEKAPLLDSLQDSRITILRNTKMPSSARSTVVERISIERQIIPFSLDTKTLPFEFRSYSEDQIVVVLKKWLRHHYATTTTTTGTFPRLETGSDTIDKTTGKKTGTGSSGSKAGTGIKTGYREAVELGIGDVGFMRKGILHALQLPTGGDFMFIRWSSNSSGDNRLVNLTRKTRIKGKRLFEMPASDLGAISSETILLKSGQAYDPDNEADCDVVVVVLKGMNLQVIPFEEFVQHDEAVLIPAGEGVILWNKGIMPVTMLAIQLCRALNKSIANDGDAYWVEASYRTRGKVM